MDIESLTKALDNDSNEFLLNYNTKKIRDINKKIIEELSLSKEVSDMYLKKLKEYKYIDEISDIRIGGFIKWIPITDPNYLPLNNGGIVCEIKIGDNGLVIVCKNFMHKYFQVNLDECLCFQKLTHQQLILLSALDHITK